MASPKQQASSQLSSPKPEPGKSSKLSRKPSSHAVSEPKGHKQEELPASLFPIPAEELKKVLELKLQDHKLKEQNRGTKAKYWEEKVKKERTNNILLETQTLQAILNTPGLDEDRKKAIIEQIGELSKELIGAK